MMKFWLGFVLFFFCGCWMHSQDLGNSSIIKIDGAIIIQNDESDPIADKVKTERKSLSVTRKKQTKQHKNIQKRNTKLGSVDSRKNRSEKKTQIKTYKSSDDDWLFSTSLVKKISAVFSSNTNPDLKKNFNNYIFLKRLFKENFIKKNTYFYLFFKDSGSWFEFFNKPPPAI
ncbi:hypothetical protein [Chryseobacterium sp.]|uniref:hypothetical protein n=1 Tax=Chryseobacterium sp. TaxID=1871047 RepID=UPI0035C6B89F